jgi:transposase
MLVRALGVERAVVQGVDWEGDGVPGLQALLLRVGPRKKEELRCPKCGKRCPRYDRGSGEERRWRAPDVGLCPTYVVAEAPRVRCREHGVLVQRVPWARHRSTFTRAFEDQVAWLAVRTDKTTLSGLLKIAWRSVGRILARATQSMKGERGRVPTDSSRSECSVRSHRIVRRPNTVPCRDMPQRG